MRTDDVADVLHQRVAKLLDFIKFKYTIESHTSNELMIVDKFFTIHVLSAAQRDEFPVSRLNTFVMKLDEVLRDFWPRDVIVFEVEGPYVESQTCLLNTTTDHDHLVWRLRFVFAC